MEYLEEKRPSRKVLFQHTDVGMILRVSAAAMFVSLIVAAIIGLAIPTSYAGVIIFCAGPALCVLAMIIFGIAVNVNDMIKKKNSDYGSRTTQEK